MRENRSVGGIWVLVILVAIGAWLAWSYFTRETEPEIAANPDPAALAESTARLVEHHPIAAVQGSPALTSSAPLPALHQSDSSVTAGLLDLVAGDGLQGLLVSTAVIPRIVATVDALPRKQLAPNILPLRGADGVFRVSKTDAGAVVRARANGGRYAPYLRAIENVDVPATVDWYVRHYPLFQQAYRELGYPDRHFNDRLIAVIDHLLAAPEPSTPPVLFAEKGLWAYADPQLEALSAGQKLMLRAGFEHERMLKKKLRELRSRLTGQVIRSAEPVNATSVVD